LNRQFDQPAGAEITTSVADPGANETDRPRTHSLAERIIETSLDLILVVDSFGNLRRVSPSCASILGYRPDEMIGRNAADFLYADDLEGTREEMRLARRGRSTRNFECRYVHRDGRVVSLVWTGVWSEPDREYFFIGRDMTERIRLEAQLRQAQKMEAIGQLTGGIAHDFNNILTTIISTAELLGDEVADTPRLAELVRCIDEAGERGAQLTHRLLAIARKQPLEVRTLNLNETIGRMVPVLQRTLGEDIGVKAAPATGLWSTLADSSQLEDTILNLAVNARDAMPQGGQLVIETANAHLDDEYAAQNVDVAAGDYVALIVTDSGTGMPPDVIERAFEPFFTTKSAGQGTGLGLSMVYGFVKQSGGHIQIYSAVGEGTTVKLYFPRNRERSKRADAVEQEIPAAPPLARQSTETVLVVEDDEEVARFTSEVLREAGHRVLAARDGTGALRLLERNPEVALLFTDVVLPGGMNGRDLAREAKKRRPDLKVLYATGYSRTMVLQDRIDSEEPLLTKPFTYETLASKVRQVLERACEPVERQRPVGT
jgi:PAS domain S-box-containing protein